MMSKPEWEKVSGRWLYRPGGVIVRADVKKDGSPKALWRLTMVSGRPVWCETLADAQRLAALLWRVDPGAEARNG